LASKTRQIRSESCGTKHHQKDIKTPHFAALKDELPPLNDKLPPLLIELPPLFINERKDGET
jgi:hypothetical protein